MKRTEILAVLAVLALSVTMPAFSQASQSDSQTVQAILFELRGIHNDMRLTAMSQILLTELQVQQTVVNAATERVNGRRLELSDLQVGENQQSTDLAGLQELLGEEKDPDRAKIQIDQLKAVMATFKAKEAGLGTNLQTAESQLRSAQDTLDDIQRRLDETLKKLQPVADIH